MLVSFPDIGRAFALTLVLIGPASVAHAQTADDFDPGDYWAEIEDTQENKGYWHASFLGGVIVPTSTMSDSYKEGLTANLRVGYTGRMGLGLALGAAYSPLPKRDQMNAGPESHLALFTALPRYTIGQKLFRMWVGAGGGVIVERSERGTVTTTTTEVLAAGEAGIEFHLFSSGGITFMGNYSQSFGDTLKASLFSASGGLVFTFK